MRIILVSALAVLLIAGVCSAADTAPVPDKEDSINYSLGYQIGKDLKEQGFHVTPEAIMQGLEDAYTGSRPQLSPEEMSSTLEALKKKIVDWQQQMRRKDRLQAKEKYRGEGREFLARNAEKQGVVALPSGLQYQVITEGTGRVPGPHDRARIQYRATLLDGHEFDSSYRDNRPAEVRVDGVVAGLSEALQLMHEGAHWQLFVPADLAFGERGPLADRTIIYDVELLSVLPGE